MQKVINRAAYILPAILIIISCSTDKGQTVDKVREEVNAFVRSYASAVEELDAEKVIGHLCDDPEFFVFGGGEGGDLDKFKEVIRRDFFKGVKSIDVNYDKIEVRVINAETAVVLTLLEQTIIDSLANEVKLNLEDTWVCVKRNGKWKLIFSHDTLVKE